MKKFLLIISSLFLLNFSLVSADCSLSTDAPILTISGENEMKIKFKTTGSCSENINEFKVYYLKGENYSPISTIIPGENKEFYDIKWDISEVPDGEYKIKILQDGDQKTSTSSAFFTIDKTKPEIRDDFWIMPTGGEILKGNIILKWNKDSVSDSYKLDENPISFYYSTDGNDFKKIAENIENSGIYVWNSSEINSEKIFLKVSAKDLYGNEEFFVSENFFEIDNTAPKKLHFTKVGEENFSSEQKILNYTPKISVSGFEENDSVRVVIFDSKTEKIYGSADSANSDTEIQLDPLDDGEYELKILSIDSAGNKTESDEILKIYRDAFAPKAPSISYAAIIKNSLRVTVSDFSEEDKETGTFILMNGTKKLSEQSSKNNIFKLDMLPQGVYDLYVKHRDLAGNLSDSSNIKKVIFDTVGPKEVSFSIPTGVSLYGNVPLKFFAIDNVGVEKVEVFVDGKKMGEADSDLKFILDTKKFSNGIHKIKAVAKDFSGNSTESSEKNFKIFNPLKENHWSNSYVKNLFDKGVLSGENNSGVIDPDSFLNKAKALKIVSEFFSDKIKDLGDKEVLFSDVEKGVWYEKYVQDGYKNKIITGNKKTHTLEKIDENLAKTRSKEDIENGQFILKSLGYNLKISGVYDEDTRRAVANYQKANGLKASGLCGTTTIKFLNFEPNVVNGIFYQDQGLYFNPGNLINRAEVLKMILQAAKVDVKNVDGVWYQKYLDFAVKNGIMSGKENGDFALGDPVTVGEMAKMILKTKDVLEK